MAPLSTDAAAAATAAPLGSLRQRLSVTFQQSLDASFPGVSVPGAGAGEGEGPVIAQVVQCGQPKYGDYQCNNAMALFARIKGQVRVGCGAGGCRGERCELVGGCHRETQGTMSVQVTCVLTVVCCVADLAALLPCFCCRSLTPPRTRGPWRRP